MELKPSKTHISHTLNKYEDFDPEFDFLGFTVRQFAVGKYQSGKNGHGELLGFKTLIKPSKKKINLHSETVGKIIETHKSAPQVELINRLNPVIRGWANYYSTVVSKEVFSELNHIIYQQLRAWAKRRHPRKDIHWITAKYWLVRTEGWIFSKG